MGKYVRTLVITFDTPLHHNEIQMFRGAILKCLGDQADILYHNHTGESTLRYSYPLIQYKQIRGKAAIVCVEEGVDVIGQFLTQAPDSITLGEREVKLIVGKAIPERVLVQTWQTTFRYHINRWLPLNAKNYLRYQSVEGLAERVALLEDILKGNLLSMLKGLGIHLEEELKVCITNLSDSYPIYIKGVPLMAFNADFTCNLSIPNFVGIGKNASIGCGVVHQFVHPRNLFLLGGHDLEMMTIKQMLEHNPDCEISDKNLAWDSALLSAYSKELEESSRFDRIYGIELNEDFAVPDNYYPIDHHNGQDNMLSSLEQVALILGVRLNRHQQLVAANDRGYIPAMQALSATEEEIAEIRQQDRAAQGVSEADEQLAEQSIAEHLIRHPRLLVVKALTSHFSAICDRLYPYQRLLIYTDNEWMYYGEGKAELSLMLAEDIQQGKVFHGGGDNGYIGCVKDAYDEAGIDRFVKDIICKYADQ